MAFYLLFFFVLHTQAVTLSKVMSRPEGTSVQAYEIHKGRGKLFRKTNAFGPNNDLRLGQFTSKADLKSVEQKITSLIPAKDVEPPTGHQIFYKLNDKFIDHTSPLHSKLEKLFANLQQKEWNFIEGIELSSDLTEISEVNNGKLIEKKIFPQSYHCDQLGKEQVCRFKDKGILYVR